MTFEVPTDLAVERLAIAMAAGSGLRLDKLAPEIAADFRRSANAALIYQGTYSAAPTGAPHLAKRLEAIVQTLRTAAEAMDADGGKSFAEDLIRAMYARASDAEVLARVLQGIPEPAAETVEAI